MNEAIQVSAEAARRFILGKHGLWPGRRWAGKEGAREAIHAMEHLQLDPVVIVARSHDLMLHSRVTGYSPAFFDELTHQDREFFDWGGWLAVRPMGELPYWRVLMRRQAEHGRMAQSGAQYAEAIASMRARLTAGELIASRDVEADADVSPRTYRGSKEGALALYYLWRIGEAMTFERRGFERVYAATERVAPAHLLAEADEHEAELFVAKKAVAAEGIGRTPSLSLWLMRTIPRKELAAMEGELVDRGELARVEVEGWKPGQLMLATDVRRLEAVASGFVPSEWSVADAESECTLFSPLDPLVARGRAATLFGFDHIWEIYKKAEDVKYGRYTMPILFGDQLVGRIDMKTQRPTGSLVVHGLWFEDGNDASADEAFWAAFNAELGRLMTFLGVSKLDATAVADRRIRSRLKPR